MRTLKDRLLGKVFCESWDEKKCQLIYAISFIIRRVRQTSMAIK